MFLTKKIECVSSFSDFMSGIFGGQKNNCITRKCAECTTNQHCSGGEFCTRYKCKNPASNTNGDCTTNQQCPYQQYCFGNRCTDPPTSTNDCTFNSDCPGWKNKCHFGKCTNDCNFDSDCPGSKNECRNRKCKFE